MFLEDGAYTTLAGAVAILLVITLLFSTAAAAWSLARAADTQLAADATALAGSNVVASYHTAATVLDACILSMGLGGLAMAGAGLVGLLVPGVQAAAGKSIDAGVRMMRSRNEFAASASRGLQAVERSLPFLVAANGTRTASAQQADGVTVTGTALAVPADSASEFPALSGEQLKTDALEGAADGLDEVASELSRAAERTAKAKEAAWLADCGRDGANMQERAAHLSGIAPQDNPDFASSLTWDPQVAVERTRAYYRWRMEHEAPTGTGVEARADSAARTAFYRFADEQFRDAAVTEADGTVVSTVPLLPRNTEEVRGTTLYTEAVWPSTLEEGGFVLHFGTDCPGATGLLGAPLPLSAIDDGSARECPVCHFSVGDVGRTPAASTSIDNGFEYHLRAYTLALDDYVAARNEELEIERRARSQAEVAADAFDQALGALGGKRPRIAPPGRKGCVGLVAAGEFDTPDEFESIGSPGVQVGARGAVSASVLAPDAATRDNNVLSRFFGTLEERVGSDGPVGLVGGVMDLWGELLMSYGDIAQGMGGLVDDLLGGLSGLGAGPIADWLGARIAGAVRGLGIEPVDLSLRKPVLTDSARVISSSGMPDLADVQDLLRSIPLGSTDPVDVARAVGYAVGEYVGSAEFTIAEIPLPGGGSIPLTVRLRDVAAAGGGR